MGTTEKVTFYPDDNADRCTQALKEAWIESDIYGLRSAIKKFGVDRFKKNSLQATEGFDWVLKKIFSNSTNCAVGVIKNETIKMSNSAKSRPTVVTNNSSLNQ
jgi:hypothetical protein